MQQESQSKTWIVLIVAIISGTAVICAAIIGLGAPFAERMADRYLPPSTPTTTYPLAPTTETLATEIPQTGNQPTAIVNSPSPSTTIMSQTELLGQWLYQQSRAPMPSPAGVNQVIFAHGDIDNTGTCHVKEFGSGEPVQGLGLGSLKLWLITGTAEYIKDVEAQLQSGAASHAGTDCPYIP